jgi:hypothetical protein
VILGFYKELKIENGKEGRGWVIESAWLQYLSSEQTGDTST